MILESPDAPSSTPEPDDQTPSLFPLYSAPPHSSSSPPSLANELHLKLQDHANSRKRGRPSLLRQDAVDGSTDQDTPPDQLQNHTTIQNHTSNDLEIVTQVIYSSSKIGLTSLQGPRCPVYSGCHIWRVLKIA